jgi:hypothetical protein
MICIGMGSALPLSFRKGFRPEEQDRDELVCPLIRPLAKDPQAHIFLPLSYHCLPLRNAPKGLRHFCLARTTYSLR